MNTQVQRAAHQKPEAAERLWRYFIITLGGGPLLVAYLPTLFLVWLIPVVTRSEVIYLVSISSASIISFAIALTALYRRWPMAVSLAFGVVPSALLILSYVTWPEA